MHEKVQAAGSMNWLSACVCRLTVPLFIAADANEDLVDEHGNKIAIPEKHGTPILHTRPKSNKQRTSQVWPRQGLTAQSYIPWLGGYTSCTNEPWVTTLSVAISGSCAIHLST